MTGRPPDLTTRAVRAAVVAGQHGRTTDPAEVDGRAAAAVVTDSPRVGTVVELPQRSGQTPPVIGVPTSGRASRADRPRAG
ncbi:hypothetical protein [Pseudonocardia sp. NPDC049635]|uniref:hypothetical protein n=1 Tax=Pseudonocardia sp. NPDC049635 TaxID=3155506 RepID=UPI0033DB42E8